MGSDPCFRIARLFCLLLTAAASPVVAGQAAADKFQGHVFLDANGNGRRDTDEKGIPGVQVTDGMTIVVSDAAGAYSVKITRDPVLPVLAARVVSVSWASGMWPSGPWHRRASTVKPGEAVDFGLRPDPDQKVPFTLGHASDPHNNLGLPPENKLNDDIKRLMPAMRFFVMTGDLGYASADGADETFSSMAAFTKNFPVPLFHTIGNHDVIGLHSRTWAIPDDIHGSGAFTKYLGPTRWSFNYAGVHLVGLDWAMLMDDGKLETGVPDTAIAWLERDLSTLKPGTRILVFIHSQWDHTSASKEAPRRDFYNVLTKHKVEIVLAGHSHRNLDASHRGIPTFTVRNLMGGYCLINVNENGITMGDVCLGCKGGRGSHAKVCIMKGMVMLSARRDQSIAAVDGVKLPGSVRDLATVPEGPFGAQVAVEPGTAKRIGLRFTPPGGKPIEAAMGPHSLVAGDARTIFTFRPDDEGKLLLDAFVEDGKMHFYANDHQHVDTTVKIPPGSAIQFFAEGGEATVTRAEVWKLKPGVWPRRVSPEKNQ